MIIGLDEVKEVEQVLIKIANGGNLYTIVSSAGTYGGLTHEAQNFLVKEASIVTENNMRASAIVINSLPNRLLTIFFIKMFKP